MPREKESIDLGLAILSVLAEPGVRYSRAEIAAWCDCDDGTIRNIEAKAMTKLRRRMKRIDLESDDTAR